MRIRFSFAAAFIILLLLASSAGLLPHSALPSTPEAAKPYIPSQSDKVLHFLTFFALTITFYFIFDTARRRVLHLTLVVCTVSLGVGSEVAQGLLPNGRQFDAWDVLANVIGSGCAIGLATAYHKRALERKRRAKYSALTGEGIGEGEDLEMGVGVGSSAGMNGDIGHEGQETGIVAVGSGAIQSAPKTVEEELANWDENVPDEEWDEDDAIDGQVKGFNSIGVESTPKKLAVD